MAGWLRERAEGVYEGHIRRSITEGPDHVAVIQDGNRRFARKQGAEPTDGHREGAETTEQVLHWCEEVGVEELTVYAFSTENFERPPKEREALFDLIESKLRKFADADRVHEKQIRIRAIGDTHRLPDRVQEAIAYADDRTRGYDRFVMNVALAYGGRAQLLGAARSVAREVEAGEFAVDEIDVETIEELLYDEPVRDVDLIIRTGGDERTSNFLPWHANGNEAAVFFCTAYWPEFRKIDFLRSIRTYEHRQESRRRTRAKRALALLQAISGPELTEAQSTLSRFRSSLPGTDDSSTRDRSPTSPEEPTQTAD